MKKKLVSAILATVMATMLIGGYGSSASSSDVSSEETGAEEKSAETEEESSSGKQYTIAMITYSLAEEFGVDALTGAQEVADKYGINLVYQDPAADMQKDISIMEDLITQGVDAICISPIDAEAIVPYINQAREAGIVVVDWDIETQAEVDAKVLTDNYEGGALGADYLVEKMGTEGTVLLVTDLDSVTSTYERLEGFRQRMAEIAPDVEIIEQLSSGTRDTHRTTVENMLQAYPEITGIFCPDGDRTLGAYVACQANNRQDVLIAGYDATPEQKEIMQEDGADCNMICATNLHPEVIGSTAAEIAYKILEGEEVDDVTYVEIDLMTAEDVAAEAAE